MVIPCRQGDCLNLILRIHSLSTYSGDGHHTTIWRSPNSLSESFTPLMSAGCCEGPPHIKKTSSTDRKMMKEMVSLLHAPTHNDSHKNSDVFKLVGNLGLNLSGWSWTVKRPFKGFCWKSTNVKRASGCLFSRVSFRPTSGHIRVKTLDCYVTVQDLAVF